MKFYKLRVKSHNGTLYWQPALKGQVAWYPTRAQAIARIRSTTDETRQHQGAA